MEEDTKIHKCHICGIRFATKYCLQLHTKRHISQENNVLVNIDVISSPGSSMTSHTLTHSTQKHGKERIYTSDKGFSTGQCPKLKMNEKVHRSKKRYPCEYCSMVCLTSFGLSSHVRYVHVLPQKRKNEKKDRKTFKCSHCEEYMFKIDLEMHLKSIYTDRNPDCYCLFCPANFSSYIDLQNHMEENHECNIEGSWRKKTVSVQQNFSTVVDKAEASVIDEKK